MSKEDNGGQEFVFLHGGMQGSWVWEEVIASLADRSDESSVRTLCLDVPGCGVKRGRDTSGLNAQMVINELVDEARRAGLNRPILVGHSQAGTILPGMVTSAPDYFRGAVYVACCAPSAGQTVQEMMGLTTHGENPDAVGFPLDPTTTAPAELMQAMFCNDMDLEEARIFLSKLGRDNWPAACSSSDRNWSYPARSGVPSSYILALKDNALPAAWQRKFAERINVVETLQIDAGHQVMQTAPKVLAEILAHLAVHQKQLPQ